MIDKQKGGESSDDDSGGKPRALLRPNDPDWDDYWAHKVAEKAKSKVLGYFGIATVILTIIGMKGLDEVRKNVEEKFEKEIMRKEKSASAKMDKLLADFERHVETNKSEVNKRRDDFLLVANLNMDYKKSDLKEVIDLSAAIGPIRDQGQEGATVGFSVAYSLQAAIKSKYGKVEQLSPRGIYVLARKYDEYEGDNYEGTSVTGGLKALKAVGAYTEAQWPYKKDDPSLSIPPNIKPVYRLSKFKQLSKDVQAIVQALQNGEVPIATITVTDDFGTVSSDGRVVIRSTLEHGGHSVAIVGYDPNKAEFKFANMWGNDWGLKGFGIIRDSDLKKILIDLHVPVEVDSLR